MATVTYCDKCKSIIQDGSQTADISISGLVVQNALIRPYVAKEEFELCEKCTDGLMDWINEE